MASSFFDFSKLIGPANKSSSVRRLSASALENVASIQSNGIGVPASVCLQEKLEEILDQRRQRESFFDAELFADPAWDILLTLALAEIQFHRMSVTRLCELSNVPSTTALRWIKHLSDRGYVVRYSHHLDNRRAYLELSERTSEAMRSYLESLISTTVGRAQSRSSSA